MIQPLGTERSQILVSAPARLMSACACLLQRKLSVGSTNDPSEHAADRIANQVLSAPLGTALLVRAKDIRRASPGASGLIEAPASVATALGALGQPLDVAVRSDLEERFGYDFSEVRIHTDAAAAASARDVDALAYTVGKDIVFGRGQFSATTASGRRLLAHELVHTLQQAPDAIQPKFNSDVQQPAPGYARHRVVSDVVARVPDDLRRETVGAAARWLVAMARQVELMRQIAGEAFATTTGSAAAPRAFHRRLNQEVLGRLLNNAISVFEAQRRTSPDIAFPVESLEQTRLGEAFAQAMEQFGLAMEEARANAARLAPTVQESEEAAYASNHLRWLETNPAAPMAAGIRDRFTRTEVDISTRRHQRVTTELTDLVANVHRYNLAGNGAQRLSLALQNALYLLVQDPATGSARSERDTTLVATIQPVLDSLDGIEWVICRAVDRLVRAEQLTRNFISDAAANPAVGTTLQTHFATRDLGYAGLLADRLARMARELRGQGALIVHARDPQDPHCGAGAVGGGLSVTAAHAEPNHFYFCTNVTIGDEERVSTVIHETAHAVIPALGALGPVSAATDGPDDRAYTFDRVYSRLSTEEALDNAESYAFYVHAVLGLQIARASAPQDQITGCSDPEAVRDAIARATYRIRLAAMWAGQRFEGETPGHPPQHVVDVIRHGFPGADDARAQEVRMHISHLASSLNYYLPVQCRPASDREARSGALAYGPTAKADAATVSAVSRRYSGDVLRICPAWLAARVDAREDSLTSILVLRYRSSVPLADVAGITGIVRFVQEQAHPSVAGRSLAQHQAADTAIRPGP